MASGTHMTNHDDVYVPLEPPCCVTNGAFGRGVGRSAAADVWASGGIWVDHLYKAGLGPTHFIRIFTTVVK